MSYSEMINRYNELKSKVKTRANEFNKLMSFVEQNTTWLTAPASIRYHLNEDGGLLKHSVNVTDTILKLKNVLVPYISDESCKIVALLHDMSKVGNERSPLFIKKSLSKQKTLEGLIEYKFNYDIPYLSVQIRSLYITQKFIYLTGEEVQAIVYHDG